MLMNLPCTVRSVWTSLRRSFLRVDWLSCLVPEAFTGGQECWAQAWSKCWEDPVSLVGHGPIIKAHSQNLFHDENYSLLLSVDVLSHLCNVLVSLNVFFIEIVTCVRKLVIRGSIWLIPDLQFCFFCFCGQPWSISVQLLGFGFWWGILHGVH